MFIDARNLPNGAVIETDLCVVGAGAAGITIARQLIDTGIDVCLLESGGLEADWQTQSLAEVANVGLPYFADTQIRYFGGNTNGWGGWFRPLDPIDFRYRSWVPNSGWPFPPSTLAPFYPRAHELCQIESDDYDITRIVGALKNVRTELPAFDPDKFETTVYRFSPPTRFGRVYRDNIRAARNVRCLLNASVLGIRSTYDAHEVTHLDVGCLSGTRFRVKAKRYVLAAGGFENARLLLLSNDVAANGLGNERDLVGRYLMEHPHSPRTIITNGAELGRNSLYGFGSYRQAMSARVALTESLQEREELLSYSANIVPEYVGQETDGWLALRKLVLMLSRSRRPDPFIRFPPYGRKRFTMREVLDIVRQIDRVTVGAILEVFQPPWFIDKLVLWSKWEQAPNRESRLIIDSRRDAFGLNRVKFKWDLLPIDWYTLSRAEELFDAELRRLRLGFLAPIETVGRHVEGGWHQLGSTRMHDDPHHGVVDAHGRVHGMSNLFIVGGSTFPTEGVAPPTLTVVALALRFAEHVQREQVDLVPSVTTRPVQVTTADLPLAASAAPRPAAAPVPIVAKSAGV